MLSMHTATLGFIEALLVGIATKRPKETLGSLKKLNSGTHAAGRKDGAIECEELSQSALVRKEKAMRAQNLPTINARYWCAIAVASMAGANTGDFAARYLHLGHTGGLLPLALVFVAIVWAETRSRRATEAYYWLAIIVLRTGATNLADLATHDLHLGYPLTLAALAAVIIAILLFVCWRDGAAPASADGRKLPATDSAYWLAMLTAGTLGTAGGDFTADELGLGVGYGSLVLLAVFLIVLFGAVRIGKMSLFWYWAAIVAARTAGTTMGDFLAQPPRSRSRAATQHRDHAGDAGGDRHHLA